MKRMKRMKRIIAVLAVVGFVLAIATPAQAEWHVRRCQDIVNGNGKSEGVCILVNTRDIPSFGLDTEALSQWNLGKVVDSDPGSGCDAHSVYIDYIRLYLDGDQNGTYSLAKDYNPNAWFDVGFIDRGECGLNQARHDASTSWYSNCNPNPPNDYYASWRFKLDWGGSIGGFIVRNSGVFTNSNTCS